MATGRLLEISSTGPSVSQQRTSHQTPNSAVDDAEMSPEGGLLDSRQPRYVSNSSAIAFPRILGLHLASDNPPNLHSFGYNFGIRPEEKSPERGHLRDLISEDELVAFSHTFFSVFGVIVDIIDPKLFVERCHDYYQGHNVSGAFPGIAAGVVAIGSFLSFRTGHPREIDIVDFAKMIVEDPAGTRKATVDLVVAWCLRVCYLRLTTRPNNSWLASCITMHLSEALGIHQEENIVKISRMPGALESGLDPDRLRLIFWCSWAIHTITCYEYGRSVVSFQGITCGSINPKPGFFTNQWVQLAGTLPSHNSPFQQYDRSQDPSSDTLQRLQSLAEVPTNHPFLTLTKADLAFYFYRKLRSQNVTLSEKHIQLITTAGNDAVESACQVVQEGRLFHNALGSVFQYTCVLLAIDTPTSNQSLVAAFRGLKSIVETVDTRLTQEAMSTARHLLRARNRQKKQDMSVFEAVDNLFLDSEIQTETPDLDLDWDQFFHESYELFLHPPDLQYET